VDRSSSAQMSAHGGGIGGDGMAQLRVRVRVSVRARVRVQRAVVVVSRRGMRGQRAWAWARRGRGRVGCHDAHEAHGVGHAVVVLRRIRCANASAVSCVRWALGAVGMGGM
jgi:hypothetical protein